MSRDLHETTQGTSRGDHATDLAEPTQRRVLVVGATGVLGRPLSRALVAAGHTVFATARSAGSAAKARELGAQPVDADLLDRSALAHALRVTRPDAIFHIATAIPDRLSPRRIGPQMRPTGELRTVGARNLVDLGLPLGCDRIVAPGLAFAYSPGSAPDAGEDESLDVGAGGGWGDVVRRVSEMEQTLLNASGAQASVLRLGYVYGPGSAFARDGSIAAMVMRRQLPVVGPGTGRWSFVHADDAAAALAAALDAPPGIYNIVDDAPRAVSDWLPAYAKALGAPPPRHVPSVLSRLAAGEHSVRTMVQQRGASNAKAVRDLGWHPRALDWSAALHDHVGVAVGVP